ncbi:MAG: HEAT repeat domain-containing protein [Treponema sp.]
MSKEINRLKSIAQTALSNPELLSNDDMTFITKSVKSSNDKLVSHTYWTIGEIGMNRPEKVAHLMNDAFVSLKDKSWEVREKALFAIGKTGRADISIVANRIDKIMQMHCDPIPKVRLSMLAACENIAHTKARLFGPYIGLFERLLDDPDETFVRAHAPEIFRVIGKYEPEIVERSLVLLKEKLHDPSPAAQSTAVGAIRTIEINLRRTPTV